MDPSQLYSLTAEKAVLSTMLMHQESIDDISAVLAEQDFFSGPHQDLYRVILGIRDKGLTVDPILLIQTLQHERIAEKVGAPGIIAELMSSYTTHYNAMQYVAVIAEKATRRALLTISDKIQLDVNECNEAKEALENAESAIFGISRHRQNGQIYDTTACLMSFDDDRDRIQRGIKKSRLKTGITQIDQLNDGIPSPGFVVIAAAPGCGKSALGFNFLQNWCKDGIGVGFFSLEMTIPQLMKRSVASLAHMDSRRLNNELSDWEQHLAQNARNMMAAWKFWIDPAPDLNPSILRSKGRAMARKGARALIIDYLQLMKGSDPRDDRREQIGDITRSAKLLSNELDVPIIMLAQLNREGRKEGEPQLFHLKESSSIEEDADAVLLMWEHPEEELKKNFVKAKWAKYRDGSLGTMDLNFDKPELRFY